MVPLSHFTHRMVLQVIVGMDYLIPNLHCGALNLDFWVWRGKVHHFEDSIKLSYLSLIFLAKIIDKIVPPNPVQPLIKLRGTSIYFINVETSF